MSELRVLMVDDHPLAREGLRGILERHPNVQIVGEAGNGLEAVVLAQDLQPDVVMMDVRLPILDGVEATRRIKQAFPTTTVVGLSVQKTHSVEHAMREAGADAFIVKDLTEEQLYRTIMLALERHQTL